MRGCSRYIYFLMLRPLPRSTLFPYTTLFRSAGGCEARRAVRIGGRSEGRGGRGRRRGDDSGRRRDRKSTRLNSSHITISYAVFCLKKKTDHSRHPLTNVEVHSRPT